MYEKSDLFYVFNFVFINTKLGLVQSLFFMRKIDCKQSDVKEQHNNITMIGKNWMIRMDDDCFPNKATHRPDDMGELFGNGSVDDLIWFINKGRVLAVATFASVTPYRSIIQQVL